jgi:hypothetical protein
MRCFTLEGIASLEGATLRQRELILEIRNPRPTPEETRQEANQERRADSDDDL